MSKFILNENNVLEYQTNNNISIYFSTKLDGVSKNLYSGLNLGLHVGDDHDLVMKNREIYFNKINVDLYKTIFCEQTHSDNCCEVTNLDAMRGYRDFKDGINNCDAIYTFEDDLCLNAYYADCTPIYLFHEPSNLTCVIHAGWQGTVKQIVKKTINHICYQAEINPNELTAIIGPSINVTNFYVKDDVIDLILKMDNYDQCVTKVDDNSYLLDVKRLNLLQLQSFGIKDTHVCELDTYENELFYSFRKENTCGRMMASIIKRT